MAETSLSGLRKELERLRSRMAWMRMQLAETNTIAVAANTQQPKRFRVAAFQTTALLTNVSGTVSWSTPLPSDSYKVDAACPALATMPNYTITNQTATGCTITFTSPVLLAVGTTVIVIAVAPAS